MSRNYVQKWHKRRIDGTVNLATFKAHLNEDAEPFALRVYATLMPYMSDAGLAANAQWIASKTGEVIANRRPKS